MAEEDNRTEDERIQAILQQNDSWSPTRDQFQQSSPPPRNNQMPGMSNMNHGMGAPDMFNPMMAMNGPNMMSYQQQMQMQQFMMQQQQQQQQMSRNQNTQPGMRQPGQLPPETQLPPAGYVCYKCNQPGHWIYYCPNVPKGVHVRATNNGTAPANGVQQMQAPAIMPSQVSRVPLELLCRIDNKLMKDAVLVPCCGKSFCRECIKTTLASNPNCPSCGSSDVDVNRLIPNKSLRNSIQKYKDEHGDPDDQPLEPPPTQEAAPIIEEPSTPVETSSTENKPRNGNQAPTEVPQSPPKRNAQPARQYPTSGMPIQVFQSEERVQKNKPYNKQDDGDNDFSQQGGMMEQNEFYNGGGGDMGWMGMMGMPPNMMGMPPGMNPAMMAGMMGMGMPPPGGFPGFFPGPGGFPPPFPPPEMFGFPGNMNLGAGRGGFGGRGGRGGGRGGMKPSGPPRRVEGAASHHSPSTPTRQDVASPAEHKEEATVEDIPTGPRAERDRHDKPSHHDRPSSRNRHNSRSRSPKRHESDDRHHYSDRHHSRSSSRHHDRDTHRSSSKRRSRSRRRSPSERRSRSVSERRSRSPAKKRSPTPTGPRQTDEVARPVDSVVESVLDEIIFDEEPAPAPSEHDRKEHDSKRRSRERSSSRSRSSRSRHRDSRDSRHRHRSSDRHSRRQRSRDRR